MEAINGGNAECKKQSKQEASGRIELPNPLQISCFQDSFLDQPDTR